MELGTHATGLRAQIEPYSDGYSRVRVLEGQWSRLDTYPVKEGKERQLVAKTFGDGWEWQVTAGPAPRVEVLDSRGILLEIGDLVSYLVREGSAEVEQRGVVDELALVGPDEQPYVKVNGRRRMPGNLVTLVKRGVQQRV